MWALASSKYDNPSFVYIYKKNRVYRNAIDILESFKGYLHSDRYGAYQRVCDVINVGCLAHARRKYVEIMKASDSSSTFYHMASIGKTFIDKLYKIEHQIDKLSIEEKYRIRKTESIKVLNEYEKWLTKTIGELNPSFAISKAINYSINNRAERMMKSFVIGRKNFLFCFTENGAETSSILYSIIETSYANDIKVEEYLTYLFDMLPNINKDEQSLSKLLPYSKELPQH